MVEPPRSPMEEEGKDQKVDETKERERLESASEEAQQREERQRFSALSEEKVSEASEEQVAPSKSSGRTAEQQAQRRKKSVEVQRSTSQAADVAALRRHIAKLPEQFDESAAALRDYGSGRCRAVGSEKAGKEMMEQLLLSVKGDGEGTSTGPKVDAARDAGLRIVADLVATTDITFTMRQAESLVDRCVQPFVRSIKKRIFEPRDIDLAKRISGSFKKLAQAWPHMERSPTFRRSVKMVKEVIASATRQKDEPQHSQRRSHHMQTTTPQKRRESSSSRPGPFDAAEVSPVPLSAGGLIPPLPLNGGAPPALKKNLDLAAILPPTMLQTKKKEEEQKIATTSNEDQVSKVVSYFSGFSSSKIAPLSKSPGKDARYDACRFGRDVCAQLKIPRETSAAAFYYLHTFLLFAGLEPRDTAPCSSRPAIDAAMALLDRKGAAHAAALALTKKPARPVRDERKKAAFTSRDYLMDNLGSGALRDASNAYLAFLPADEVAAVVLAAVHLAGKARDLAQRLTHVVDAGRRALQKRQWPLAMPWRDQILLAEHRLLRCLCFDLRVDDAKDILDHLCPDDHADSYLYNAENTTNSAASFMEPPSHSTTTATSSSTTKMIMPTQPRSVDPKLKVDALDQVLATCAFETTGLVVEHDPNQLVVAAVYCAWNHVAKRLPENSPLKAFDTDRKNDWLNAVLRLCYDAETSGEPLLFGAPKRTPPSTPDRETDDARSSPSIAQKNKAQNNNKKASTTSFGKIQIRGIISEIEATNLALRARFFDANENQRRLESVHPGQVRKARYDAALRAAFAARDRLADDDFLRYVIRRSNDRAPAANRLQATPASGLPPDATALDHSTKSLLAVPTSHRRRRDDECGVYVYFSDDPDLAALAKSRGNNLDLVVFPFRDQDEPFRRAILGLDDNKDNDKDNDNDDTDKAVVVDDNDDGSLAQQRETVRYHRQPASFSVGAKVLIPGAEAEFRADDDPQHNVYAKDEPDTGVARHFAPVLHVLWPKADFDESKLGQKAKEDALKRTKDLVEAIRRRPPPARQTAPLSKTVEKRKESPPRRAYEQNASVSHHRRRNISPEPRRQETAPRKDDEPKTKRLRDGPEPARRHDAEPSDRRSRLGDAASRRRTEEPSRKRLDVSEPSRRHDADNNESFFSKRRRGASPPRRKREPSPSKERRRRDREPSPSPRRRRRDSPSSSRGRSLERSFSKKRRRSSLSDEAERNRERLLSRIDSKALETFESMAPDVQRQALRKFGEFKHKLDNTSSWLMRFLDDAPRDFDIERERVRKLLKASDRDAFDKAPIIAQRNAVMSFARRSAHIKNPPGYIMTAIDKETMRLLVEEKRQGGPRHDHHHR